MSENQPQPEKPIWEVQARPLGEPETPWTTMRVRASSIPQADAIMRRRGYEIATQSAILADGEPDTLPSTRLKLKPIVCSNCGYPLAGLTLEKASVTCTECSHSQPLMHYAPDPHGMIDRNHPIIGVLAVIGAIALVLIMLPIVVSIVFAII